MTVPLPDYYEHFLETLKLKATSQSQLVKELCDLLNLQNRAIYNRLNGETQFTINEAILICKSYQIDIQEILLPDTDNIIYHGATIGRKISKPTDYLSGLVYSLNWLNSLKNPKVHYTSHDFPLFLTCAYPRLIKLKLAIWSYYTWEIKNFTSTTILDLDDAEFDGVDELCKKMVDLYSRVPSIEFIPSSLFDNTIYQIRFLIEVQGFLHKDHLRSLLNDLEATIADMEEMATSGSKNPATIQFYRSDMLNQSLNFMVDWEEGCRVYTMIDSPNYIYTESPKMIHHMKDYFRKIVQSAESLTQSNAKERRIYFNSMFQKVKVLRDL